MANYCGKCGSKLDDTTGLCPNCDKEQLEEIKRQVQKTQSKPNGAKRILKFLLALLLTILLLCGSIGALSYFDVIHIPGMDKLFSNMGIQKRDRDFEDVDESAINYENYKVEPPDAEEYFQENAEIVETVDTKNSSRVLTESGVTTMLKDRGLSGNPITANYSMEGEYSEDFEISDSSEVKHPTYQTYYQNESGELWIILVVEGDVVANPLSFNLQSSLGAQLIVSESDTVTSYDSTTNKYFRTKPKDSAVILRIVERVDATTLDTLTAGELAK